MAPIKGQSSKSQCHLKSMFQPNRRLYQLRQCAQKHTVKISSRMLIFMTFSMFIMVIVSSVFLISWLSCMMYSANFNFLYTYIKLHSLKLVLKLKSGKRQNQQKHSTMSSLERTNLLVSSEQYFQRVVKINWNI